MSLVIDMKTREVLQSSAAEEGPGKDQSALPVVPGGCDLRLVALEPDRMNLWRQWVPGLLSEDEDKTPDTDT